MLLFITYGAVRVLAGGGGGPGVMLYKGITGPAKSSGEQDGVLIRGGGCFSPWVAFTHTYCTDTNTVSGLLCARLLCEPQRARSVMLFYLLMP